MLISYVYSWLKHFGKCRILCGGRYSSVPKYKVLKLYVVRDFQKMQTGRHVKLVILREHKCTITCKV